MFTAYYSLPEMSRVKNRSITDETVVRLKQQITNVTNNLYQVAALVQRKEEFLSNDSDVMTEAIRDLILSSGFFDQGLILDQNGDVLISYKGEATDEKVNLANQPYFTEAVRTKTTYISNIIEDLNGKRVIVVSVPVFNLKNGEERIVCLFVQMDKNGPFQSIFQSVNIGGGGYAYIVDGNGRILSHPDISRIGDNVLAVNRVVQKVTQRESGYEKVVNSKGVSMYASYTYLPRLDWGIVAQVPEQEIYASFRDFQKSVWVMAVLSFLFLSFLTAVFTKQTLRPIRRLYEAVEAVTQGNYELYLEEKDQTELGQLTRRFNQMIATIRDSRKQIEYQAYHDSLTGLPNRTLFKDHLERILQTANLRQKKAAVLFLDLDRFYEVNDSLGHQAGDQLLVEVGKRFNELSPLFLYRLGGDEFTVIIPEIDSKEDVVGTVENLMSKFAEPFELKGREFFVTVSIGISIFPDDGEDGNSLLQHADTAMYKAKEQMGNSHCFFEKEWNSNTESKLSLTRKLRRALENDELLIYYQPKFQIASGQISGMEALLRWYDRDTGMMVPPKEFIPLAEESGLISSIGEWVLKHVCTQMKHWLEGGYPPLRVSVNLSPQQFQDDKFVDTVRRILQETGLSGEYLEFEITERVLMKNEETVHQVLRTFKEMGVFISIDDFGTGYSSLSYLKQFPIDVLKIDQSFINNITNDPDNASITSAIIQLAHNLNAEVIAEGVETEEQLHFLRDKQCDAVQGYFISPPVPPHDFAGVLKQHLV